MFAFGSRVGGACVVALAFALAQVSVAGAQGVFERLSVASTGEQGDGASYGASTSGDGRFTAFVSNAPNLVAGDTNGRCDLFVRDAGAGATTRVSVSSDGAESVTGFQCTTPAISADGRFVAFASDASDLVAADANGMIDVFVRDREAGTTRRVSVASDGAEGDGNSFEPAISADGRFVAFLSGATNLVAGRSVTDSAVYVHELATGRTEWASVPLDPSASGSGASYQPSLSADGRYVAFASQRSDIVEGDTNLRPDIFVRDRALATTSRVSVRSGGGQIEEAGRGAEDPAISADGRFVAFASDARDLVPGISTSSLQVFVHDRATGTVAAASVNGAGEPAFGDDSYGTSISGDGRYVAFHTGATNLDPNHAFGAIDVVVRDTVTGVTRAMTTGRSGDDSSIFPSLSGDGTRLAFASSASFLVDGDTNATVDVFARAVTMDDELPPSLQLPEPIDIPATSPDGATVEYVVTATDDTDPEPAVRCAPASGATFGIGDTVVACTATDASGNEASGSFTVHVRGAAEQIEDLEQLVADAPGVPRSVRQGLAAKLSAAAAALAAGDTSGACEELRAFTSATSAQSGRRLDAATAEDFIDRATRIRDVIGC